MAARRRQHPCCVKAAYLSDDRIIHSSPKRPPSTQHSGLQRPWLRTVLHGCERQAVDRERAAEARQDSDLVFTTGFGISMNPHLARHCAERKLRCLISGFTTPVACARHC